MKKLVYLINCSPAVKLFTRVKNNKMLSITDQRENFESKFEYNPLNDEIICSHEEPIKCMTYNDCILPNISFDIFIKYIKLLIRDDQKYHNGFNPSDISKNIFIPFSIKGGKRLVGLVTYDSNVTTDYSIEIDIGLCDICDKFCKQRCMQNGY